MKKKSSFHYLFSSRFLLLLLSLLPVSALSAHAAVEPLSLSVETAWLSGRAEGNDTEQITVRYDSVLLYDSIAPDYPLLQQALDEMNADEVMEGLEYLDWYQERFQTYLEDEGTSAVSDFTPCSYYNTALVKRADTAVTSILYQKEAYAGGAHPNTFHSAYNFRSSDGAELSLSDVFTDTNQLREALYGQLSLCYPDLDLSPLDDYDMEDFTWVLDGDGLTIYIGEYVVGAFYDGFQTAHFPYADYSGYFASWVRESGSQGTELGNYEPIWRDLNNSGVPEIIQVGMNTGEGTIAEQSRQLTIYYNNQLEHYELPACQDLFTTFVNYGSETYLYIEASQDLDLAWYGCYRLDPQSEGKITYVGDSLPAGAELYISHIMIQYPLDMYGNGDGWGYDDFDEYYGNSEDDDWNYGSSEDDGWYYGNSENDDWDYNNGQEDNRSAFYGVWISASKDLDASWALADLIQADGVMGWVFNSSEWSNLNPEPWYLVSAGVYYTYEEALTGLARIQAAGYTDAYIKYSGDPIF